MTRWIENTRKNHEAMLSIYHFRTWWGGNKTVLTERYLSQSPKHWLKTIFCTPHHVWTPCDVMSISGKHQRQPKCRALPVTNYPVACLTVTRDITSVFSAQLWSGSPFLAASQRCGLWKSPESCDSERQYETYRLPQKNSAIEWLWWTVNQVRMPNALAHDSI